MTSVPPPPSELSSSSVEISTALKGLENCFAGAEKKLQRIEWEVDQKLAAVGSDKGSLSSAEGASDLLRSFQDIKADYQALVKEV